MPEINSYIGPGPRQTATFGDHPVPIKFGNFHVALESGGVVEPLAVAGTDLAADAEGHIYLRAGTVLVKTLGENWRPAGAAADVTAADAVGILQATIDLARGGGPVGIYIKGGFFAERMPTVADNAVVGLEADVRAALLDSDIFFAEGYHG